MNGLIIIEYDLGSYHSFDGLISYETTDLVGTLDMIVDVSIIVIFGNNLFHGVQRLMDVSLKDIVDFICLSLSRRDII